MKIEVHLETYDEDIYVWVYDAKMFSDDEYGSRVLLQVGDRKAIFMAEDLELAIQKCRTDR